MIGPKLHPVDKVMTSALPLPRAVLPQKIPLHFLNPLSPLMLLSFYSFFSFLPLCTYLCIIVAEPVFEALGCILFLFVSSPLTMSGK